MRRVRASKRPRDPASLCDLVITGDWALTGGSENVPFMRFDNGPDAAERVIVFTTDRNLQALATSDTWFMDGTFSVSPHFFAQLYVIHGKISSSFCPLVYALLQRQNKACYEECFRFVRDKSNANPSTILIDFEIAAHQAIRAVFQLNTEIRGCFYHLTQSTWRKIQQLGLTVLYKEDSDFRSFCGKLDGLALLPVDRVQEGMDYLKRSAPDAAAPLVDYFDATYVSGPMRFIPSTNGSLAGTLQRRRATFPADLWNCHVATMENQPRTNNVCEGWNNSFRNLIGYMHPSIWKLIDVMRKENERVRTIMLRDGAGVRPKKQRRRTYEELQKRLYNLCHDFVSGTKNLEAFLSGVSHNIRFGEPNV